MLKQYVQTSVLVGVLMTLAGSAFAQTPASTPAAPPIIAQATETLSARTQIRLDQLTRELSEATGRIEALEAAVMAQKSENERLARLMDEARANVVAAATTTDPVLSQTQAAELMATPAAALAQEMFVVAAPPPMAASVFLQNAQTALQSGNYAVAEANLTQLIWVHSASAEASEGRWLLGEARFVQAAWGTAAQAYVDYLKVSPNGSRATEALLRLAGSFRQLGDNRQRCVALAEFKRRAPRPDATLKARADAEIARMACPAA